MVKRIVSLLVLCGIVLMCGCGAGNSPDNSSGNRPVAPAELSAGDFTLSMEPPDKTAYTVGESFSVTAYLKNNTDGRYWFKTGQELISITLKPVGIETDTISNAILSTVPIQPGETLLTDYVFCGVSQDDPRGQNYLVDGVWQKAGTYTLTVQTALTVYDYTGGDPGQARDTETRDIGTLTLDTVTLTVT